MFTMAACMPLAREHQLLVPTYRREKSSRNNRCGGPAAQTRTFPSRPAPPSTIPKTLSARAPVLPAPQRQSPPLPRRPGPSAATRPQWGGERGLGFAAREIVLETLNGRKLFPVHLRSGVGRGSRRSPLGPRNAEPRAGAPSWVLPVPGRDGPAPFPNAPPKMGERAPPRANGEVLGPKQRMRPTESTRRAGPAPGRAPTGPRQKRFSGRALFRSRTRGPLGGSAQAGSAPSSGAPGLLWGATQPEMSRGEGEGLISSLGFAPGVASWVENGAATRPQH